MAPSCDWRAGLFWLGVLRPRVLEAGGLPSRVAGGRRVLVWEQLGEGLKVWVLVVQQDTGLVTVDKSIQPRIELTHLQNIQSTQK